MVRVEVLDERETGFGWEFRVRATAGEGVVGEHEVRLSWVDHDYWSGGACPAARVVGAVVEYLYEVSNAEHIPARIDASTVRRRHPEIDELLAARL